MEILYKTHLKVILVSIGIFIMLMFFNSPAQADTDVMRIAIAKEIKNLEPVNTGNVFSRNVNKLYCFTEIKTDDYPTKIVHIWLYNENIIAEIPLEVNSYTWRTYSSKQILPKWVGNWKVEVYSNEGKLIDSIQFSIK